jgi:deoxycytidylate deaminase
MSLELYFGLCSPLGVKTTFVKDEIKKTFELKVGGWRVENISLIHLALDGKLKEEVSSEDVCKRLNDREEQFESQVKKSGIHATAYPALLAINEIQEKRKKPDGNVLYLIDFVESADVTNLLRKVYGKLYFQIGVTANTNDTKYYREMTESKYHGNPQIIRNMRDDLQKSITKTFITSDVFIHLEDSPNSEKTKWKDALESSESSESSEKTIPDKWQRTLERFIKIVFRDPLITPTADEHNMFMAHMAATSTADLSRQVGSVITNAHYDILATGANEVQKFGGGQYWPEEDYPDQRDFNFNGGVDTNAKLLNDLSRDVYDKILAVCEKNLSAVNDSYSNIGKDIGNIEEELIATIRRGTNVKDLTEYGRAVHAEMASITSAARNGIGLKGSLMYVTTYPCHNCAKHITASGIESVTYIEPYPKSKATHSHSDSISETPKDNYVLFKAFVGIGPNRFLDLFSLGLGNGEQIKRKNQDGNAIERNLDGKEPKFLLDVNVIKAAEGCLINK